MVSRDKQKKMSMWGEKHIFPEKYKEPPDPTRKSPGKKNTRKWCKGKVGREHVTELRMKTYGWSKQVRCAPPAAWWNDTPYGRRHPRNWNCRHQEVCTVCGKIIRRFIGPDECPDFKMRSK